MKKSLLFGGAVAPLLALGQEFIPLPAIPLNTTTSLVEAETTTNTGLSSILSTTDVTFSATSETAELSSTVSSDILPETSTSEATGSTTETSILIPSSDTTTEIVAETTEATTEVAESTTESTTVAEESTTEVIIESTTEPTTAPIEETSTIEAITEETTTNIPADETTTEVIEESTTETTSEAAESTTESIVIPSQDSTTAQKPTSAVDNPDPVTTDPPTQTEDSSTKADEAKEAAEKAYDSMATYVDNPTRENAERAQDDTDAALALVTAIGGGFGALITSLGGASSALANAESEPSSTEEVSSTEEPTSTTETETTTTTATTEYPEPTFFYDFVTEAAGGSDEIASKLAESQIPELGCLSEFKLPITACALDKVGLGGDETSTVTTETTTTTSETETTTATSEAETTTDTSAETTTGTSTETSTEDTTTTAETTSTLSTLLTTTRNSESSETTSGETTESLAITETETTETTTTAPSTTTSEPERTYYPCFNYGGPRVPTPHCKCETTTNGQAYYATAPLISGQCVAYTTFPSSVPTTTQAPVKITEGPIAEPVTLTEDGTVLSYPSRVYSYAEVYTGIPVTFTYGAGTPETLATPVPTQTDANNKGSSMCHAIDNACQRAYDQFEDDTIYKDFTSRYSRIDKGFIVVASFGQAGCTAQFKCDDYGIGMSGRLIKEAIQYMKDNNGVSKCGTAYLSNTCQITLNYCTNCHHNN
ncbi:hypothetical protein ACJZ2D_010167 [Fusarium nematophilum]